MQYPMQQQHQQDFQQQLQLLATVAYTLSPAALIKSPWLAARARHVAVAISSTEGLLTVNGRRYPTATGAATARRILARRLVAAEQRFRDNPYRLSGRQRYAVSLDPFAGVVTICGQSTAVRVVRCAACMQLLPRGANVILIDDAGEVGVVGGEGHACDLPEKREFLLFDPIREALSVPVVA